jgi:cytochrome b6-f complex iron-sulfur subunit
MGNREPAPAGEPILAPSLRSLRATQASGLTRRSLLRRAVGAGIGLWVVELTAGSIGFLWAAAATTGKRVRIGTFDQFLGKHPGLPIVDGFPGYEAEARAFVVLVDPGRRGWFPGVDMTGEGVTLNVRAMSQRCPHLGCRPNPCVEDFWFRCPCHQSRYDRLGIKAAGEENGPAPHGLDRFVVEVDDHGVLYVDTRTITLGPLPVALGEPGLIPPLVENGCV